MEEIAEKAGISRSTAYRRFASKEDIILDVPRQWSDTWDQAQTDIAADATLMTALSHGSLAVAQKIDEDHELVLLAFSALAESPTLQSSGANSADWIDEWPPQSCAMNRPSISSRFGFSLVHGWEQSTQ